MRIRPSSYFLISLMLLGVVFLIYSLAFAPLEAKLVGVMASTVIIILGVIQLFRERVKATKTEEQPARGGESGTLLRRSGYLAFWMGGFIIATYTLGFLISIPLFVFSYLRSHGTGWLAVIITTAITTASVYGLFEIFLARPLWRGLISFP